MEQREGVGGGWREVEKVVCEGMGWGGGGSQATSPNPPFTLVRQSQGPAAGGPLLKYISFFLRGRLNGDLWPEKPHSLWLN